MIKRFVLVFLILVTVFLAAVGTSSNIFAVDIKKPEIRADYFYFNACSACQKDKEFYDLFNGKINDVKEDVNVSLNMYNAFAGQGESILQDYCKKFWIDREKLITPAIFINGSYIDGDAEIESKLREVFLSEKQILLENTDIDSEIYYFSISSCSDCSDVQSFLDSLDKTYTVNIDGKEELSKVSISKFDVGEENSLKLVKRLFDSYDVPENDRSVPIIFLKNGYLSGKKEIMENLLAETKNGQAVFSEKEKERLLKSDGSINDKTGYEISGVILTGLLNGLNPCSISMLLFFISMLLMKNRNILRMGLAFISGKFLAYLLLGTVLFNLLLSLDGNWFSKFQGVARVVLIIICLLLVYLNIADFISSKNEKYNKIRLQLPAPLRELNHKWMKIIQSVKGAGILTLTSFALGVVVSAGEFLCTGQIYLATIVIMIKNNPVFDLKTIEYFILYGVALVTPLLVLCIILYKGKEMFQVSEKIRENMSWIKLANAFVFLLFGIVIFFKF